MGDVLFQRGNDLLGTQDFEQIRQILLRDIQRAESNDFYFTGHESGGVHGLSDTENRAHSALLALFELDPKETKKWLKTQSPRISTLYKQARSQAQTPSWQGRLKEGISVNKVVPDAKIDALFQRRFKRAQRCESSIDFSDNSLMALRFASDPESLLWAYLIQLRATRRSALWTDIDNEEQRRDSTTGKITGSAICTALEIRMLLAQSERWLKTKESEWLFYEVVKALPFVDVHDVFAARNLVSQLRDIVGRTEVSVRDIGKNERFRIPLYAAIHQHYSADSALLVQAYVDDRVLRGKNEGDFLRSEDLSDYVDDVKMTGFARLKPEKKIEALEVVQKLYRSVKHAYAFEQNFAQLFPFVKSLWPREISPSQSRLSDDEAVEMALSLEAYWPAIHKQKDGYHAMQILRAMQALIHRLIFDSSKRKKASRKTIAQALFAAMHFGTDEQGKHTLSARHAALTSSFRRAERQVIEEGVDVDLDPRFVDALLKASPDVLLQARAKTSDRRVYKIARAMVFKPGVQSDAESALFVSHWNDPELYRENPTLVFCEHKNMCAPLSHARFWAKEKDIAILSGTQNEVKALLKSHRENAETFVWQTKAGALKFGAQKPKGVTLAKKRPSRVVIKNMPLPEGDWSSGQHVYLPKAKATESRFVPLDELFVSERPYEAFSLAGAKAVLLSLLKQKGFDVPQAFVAPFFSEVNKLSFPKISGTAICRSAAYDEDLPGHAQAGANLSLASLRSNQSRIEALQQILNSGSKKRPMSVLLQEQISPRFSGVSMSRSQEGTAMQVFAQFTKGFGGGVLGGVEIESTTLTRFQSGGARREMFAEVYEKTLAIETLLNAVFYPSGQQMHPVEVEWGGAKKRLHIFQARFR